MSKRESGCDYGGTEGLSDDIKTRGEGFAQINCSSG